MHPENANIETKTEQHIIANYDVLSIDAETRISIDKDSFNPEYIEITYDLRDEDIPKLEDDHMLDSHVYGAVTVCFDLPRYKCRAYSLGTDGKSRTLLGSMNNSTTRYLHYGPIFARQKIVWSIEKEQKEA